MKAAFAAVSVLLLCSVIPHSARIPAPALVLWAWERPEDLRFIDPATTGVAYLAATAYIQPDGAVRWRGRLQPLRTPPGTARIAVVRIESPARYIFPNAVSLADALMQFADSPGVKALQIDYDARASEHPFYRALLAELRRRTDLPAGITALASWCAGDRWLDSEPLSEAVPMFFRMGGSESKAMRVESPACASSIGLSTDEPWPPPRRVGRVYVFNPRPWTKPEYENIVARAREWR